MRGMEGYPPSGPTGEGGGIRLPVTSGEPNDCRPFLPGSRARKASGKNRRSREHPEATGLTV